MKEDNKILVKTLIVISCILLCVTIGLFFLLHTKESVEPESNIPSHTEHVDVIENAKIVGRPVKDGNIGALVETTDGRTIELFDFVVSGANDGCSYFLNRTMRIEYSGDRMISCEYDGYIEKDTSDISDKSLYEDVVETVGIGNAFEAVEIPGAGIDISHYENFIPEENIVKTSHIYLCGENMIDVQLHEADTEENALEAYKYLSYDVWDGEKVIKCFVDGTKVGRVVCNDEQLAEKLLEVLKRQ